MDSAGYLTRARYGVAYSTNDGLYCKYLMHTSARSVLLVQYLGSHICMRDEGR